MAWIGDLSHTVGLNLKWLINNPDTKVLCPQKEGLELVINNIIDGRKMSEGDWSKLEHDRYKKVNSPIDDFTIYINQLADWQINNNSGVEVNKEKGRLLYLLKLIKGRDVMTDEEEGVDYILQTCSLPIKAECDSEDGVTERKVSYAYDWEACLLQHISNNNFCRSIIHTHSNEIIIMGKLENISRCCELFSSFSDEVFNLSVSRYDEFIKISEEIMGEKIEQKPQFRNSIIRKYQWGTVAAISSKMEEIKRATTNDEKNYGIMIVEDKVVSQYFQKNYPNLGQKRIKIGCKNGWSYTLGFEDGTRIQEGRKILPITF